MICIMTSKGGISTLEGVRYEVQAVLYEMPDLLNGRLVTIRYQPASSSLSTDQQPTDIFTDDYSIEDIYGRKSFFQAKQNTKDSAWTIRRLLAEGVLGQFWRQYNVEPQSKLFFVSNISAPQLQRLADHARQDISPDEFRKTLTKEMQRHAKNISEDLEISWQDLYNLLKRVNHRLLTEDYIQRRITDYAYQRYTDVDKFVLAIRDFIEKCPGSLMTQHRVSDYLEKHGLFRFVVDTSEQLLGEYLAMVASQHEYVDMIDLQRLVRLEDIYITLKMARKMKKFSKTEAEYLYRADSASRAWRDRSERRIVEQLEEVKLSDVLKEKCLVFRGEPGVGKTTLLRHLAYTSSAERINNHPIPIFTRLADLTNQRFKANMDRWLEYYYPKQAELLKEKLQNGECIVLLDGLDEVEKADGNWESVRNEAIRLANWKNQVVLSSRTVAYPEGFMPANFRIYEVAGFSEEQQQKFLFKWFTEEPEKARKLLKAMRSNPRMRDFTKNPLLLSLTAVVCENDPYFQLPTQRVELYERATQLFMRRWNEKRTPSKEPRFATKSKREFLEEAAFYYFTKAVEIFEETDLIEFIDVWQHERGVSMNAKEQEDFLEELSVHNGFLITEAEDRYRFLHLTFQEYFTACAIHNSTDWRELLKEKYVWDPRWEEVIRLLGSLMNDASPLISLVWNPSVEDDIFNSRVLLAVRCLGDAKEADNLWQRAADRVVDRLYYQERYSIYTLHDAIMESYSLIAQRYPEALERLHRDIRDTSDHVRQAAARTLSEVASENSTKPLIDALNDNNVDSIVRWYAAEALGRIGSKDVVKPLIGALRDEDSYLREHAARALKHIDSEEVVRSLIKALRDENSGVRKSAGESLGHIGSLDAVKPLICALKDADYEVRMKAAEALKQIDSESAIDAVIGMLRDSNPGICRRAMGVIESLGDMVHARSVGIIELLIDALKDKNTDIREAAAWALGDIGTEEVIAPLIGALRDKNSDVRKGVMKALGHTRSEDAIGPLVKLMQDRSESPDIRMWAAWSLGYTGSKNAVKPLINALDDKGFGEYKRSDEWEWESKYYVRDAAAEALGFIAEKGIDCREAIVPLIDILRNDVPYIRESAAYALGEIGSEEAVEPLIVALKDKNRDKDKNGSKKDKRGNAIAQMKNDIAREKVAVALRKIGDDRAIEPLINILIDEDESFIVRRGAAEALGDMDSADAVKPLIAEMAYVYEHPDDHIEVRMSATEALYKLSRPPKRVIFHDGIRDFS